MTFVNAATKLTKTKLILIFATLLIVGNVFTAQTANALSGSDWRAGRIIDDSVFFNKNSMPPQQIQAFLNARVPVCDRNNPYKGTVYGSYIAAPYTCLKEYNENPTTKENNIGRFNPDGSPYQVPGGISAAQIIWNAGQAYGINPQALIVMLQKETAIVTDTWSAKWQYDRAMGYGCPDSGPGGSANCNTNYYGFYNQVSNAAWQLKRYGDVPDSYNFKAGVTRYIQYDVSTACGGTNVFIENRATAALYNYTPYQPNATALSNIYGGQDDGCSAYGNRNFWRMFNDWFGSTYIAPSQCDSKVSGVTCIWELVKFNGEHFYTSSVIERDISINNGFSYSGIAFYARTDAFLGQTNGIPTYRLQSQGNHIWTNSEQTYQQYKNSGWSDEGVAWYTDPEYSNTGNPVYKLRSPSNQYLYSNAQEYSRYISWGYTYNNETLNSPTKFIQTTPPIIDQMNVYRIQSCTGSYVLTHSIPEVEAMLKDACNKYEGVAFYASSNQATGSVAVNRLHYNGRYIWTTSQAEITALLNAGWKYEGVAFYASSNQATGSVAVNRLHYNGRYIWTTSQAEITALLNAGWKYEGVAFYASSNQATGSVAVNRLHYNGRYIWTTSQAEITALLNAGWKYEGVAFYASSNQATGSVAVNRLHYNGRYIWTTSQAEITALLNAGWKYEGVAFYASSNQATGSVAVNRLHYNGRYIWTTSQAEITALLNAGWKYEGVAFYISTQ